MELFLLWLHWCCWSGCGYLWAAGSHTSWHTQTGSRHEVKWNSVTHFQVQVIPLSLLLNLLSYSHVLWGLWPLVYQIQYLWFAWLLAQVIHSVSSMLWECFPLQKSDVICMNENHLSEFKKNKKKIKSLQIPSPASSQLVRNTFPQKIGVSQPSYCSKGISSFFALTFHF